MMKWFIALGIILLLIGSFFLYFGLRAYLFPRGQGSLHGGVAWTGLGSLLAIIAALLILVGAVSKHGIEGTSKSGNDKKALSFKESESDFFG